MRYLEEKCTVEKMFEIFFVFLFLVVWYTSGFAALMQTAKTTLLDFSCWESFWPTASLLTMPHVELNMTGKMYSLTHWKHVVNCVTWQLHWNHICMVCIFRYIQSLTDNISFVRYKDVYSAAAEIIGLTLKNMTEVDNVWDFPLFGWIMFLSVERLKQVSRKWMSFFFPVLASSRASQSCC